MSIAIYPPPPKVPSVLFKAKEAYGLWLPVHRDFPRVERLAIGQRIEQLFLDLLELILTASYLTLEKKNIALSQTIGKLDNIKFFLQLAWENKLIKTERYANLSQELEGVGRMLGGWRKGLEQKLRQVPFGNLTEKK